MFASSSFFSGSTKKWNSQPLNCRGSMSAFLSKPHFAYPGGTFRRKLGSAGKNANLRVSSVLSVRPCLRCFRKTSSLAGFTSFELGSSGLLQSLPNNRKSLEIRSARDMVHFETGWMPFVKAGISEEGESFRLMFVLADLFTTLSTNNFLFSVTVLATTLGVSGGFYAYASRVKESRSQNLPEPGENEVLDGWLNLSRATPFNQFVTARCPSLAPATGVSNRKDAEAELRMEPKPPEYHRLCLHAGDGGTVALDWPSHLSLEKNKELENVLLIIPGSTEGSEEKGIGKFTREAERRGYFPVVLNPRGCGGSPLTSPRVFSAADSDDVRLVAHYIAKRRPWATIMGIGWGFGANMLSKYLGEESYATPLTAAVCIDNPYNLDKVIHSVTASRWHDLDQALTMGLVKILDSNKKLFQGGSNRFDVKGGLAATSLREFETAVSTISHGYDSLQKFYEDASSSEATLERVQIPLLCIQHLQDYLGNQISLSQSAFDKNPYIALLVSPPSTGSSGDALGINFPGVASEWSHGIALEWLAAVEVALLKGRHPLLNVVDLTVKPSREWSAVGSQIPSTSSPKEASTTYREASSPNGIVESEIIDVTGDVSDLSEHPKLDFQSSEVASEQEAQSKNDMPHDYHAVIVDGSADVIERRTEVAVEKHSQEEKRKVGYGSSSVVSEEQSTSDEVERGQVQLAAESVMKVLDVTMPGTLSAEQKKQVTEAVGRGESLVGALQEAVPEDVRDKMAGAVSAAVQAKGISLKTAGFGEKIPAPKLPTGFTESLKAKLAGLNDSPGDSSSDSSYSASGKKGSDDGKKIESVAHNENPVYESPESSAEQMSPGKVTSDAGMSNVDLNKDMNINTTRHTSEYHSDRSGTEENRAVDGKISDDVKKSTNVAQSEQPTIAGHDPSQATNTAESADDLKKDPSLHHSGQASHEKSQHIDRLTQETNDGLDDQKENTSGKSQGKADEKGRSIGSTDGQVPPRAKRDAALGSKSDGVEGNKSHVDEVKEESPVASSQEGAKKTEQEAGATERRDSSPHQDELSKLDLPPANQHSGKSESKPEAMSPPYEETLQRAQNDVPAVENPASAPAPPQAPAHDEVASVPSVGQALQALIGFDDATQMAVTNVFGVVENVLDQLEKDNLAVGKSSTDAEDGHKEEPRKRKPSTIVSDHETGNSEDAPRKCMSDVRDSESNVDHDKEVNSGDRDEVVVKGVTRDGRHGGNHSGEQKLVTKPASMVVDMHRDRNGWFRGDREPQLLLSFLDKSGSQAATSAPSRDISHSPAYTDAGNERTIEVETAKIDEEVEDNERKISLDVTTDGIGEDTNPGAEDQNMVRDVVLNALKLEVMRRLGSSGLEALGVDLEEEVSKVAHAVSEAVKQTQERILNFASHRYGRIGGGEVGEAAIPQPDSMGKLGILDGNSIVQTLGTALGSTSTLSSLVPVGVLVGAVLAALGALFLIVTDDQDEEENFHPSSTSPSKSSIRDSARVSHELASKNRLIHVSNGNNSLDNMQGESRNECDEATKERSNDRAEEDEVQDAGKCTGAKHGKLVSAVTAAVGATAAVASQSEANTAVYRGKYHSSDPSETDSSQAHTVDDSGDVDGMPKFVPEIAEKAISVVSPVVPKKDDGEVDQERLVAMLAEIGQKGGVLRLVGKVALLWGGLRGAMSLADRLLGFLRIKERPLQQRLLGFLGMALLLWSPVLVPLLPTLLQQWATKSPNGVADAAAGVGLYGAVFILITIWGKRVRGYDRPLVAYGLELLSRAKLRFAAIGMAVGVNLVAAYYSINWALGFISFSWASILVGHPSFPGAAATAILTLWKVFSLVGQSVSMAIIVALVEELLFRAWLYEEIAADLGQHEAILLSALAFAVVHWSPPAMVGLWFLSVALAGARSRLDGDLSLSVGIHAGIVAAFSVVNLGGLANYLPDAPAWLTGAYAGNPLAGAIGTAMVAALAIVLYPRKQELPAAEDDAYDYDEDDS